MRYTVYFEKGSGLSHYDCLPQRLRLRTLNERIPAIAQNNTLLMTRALASAFLLFSSIVATAQASAPSLSHNGAVALAVSAPAAAPRPLTPNPAFAHYPQYRGTLGGRHIVLRIGVKPDDADGLNGEYQYLPNGPVILIAGDRDGKTLTLEESDDGTEISGQWVGFFADDGSLTGQRMNNDESDPQSFDLKPLNSALHSMQSVPSSAVPAGAGPTSGARTVTQSGRGTQALANTQGRS